MKATAGTLQQGGASFATTHWSVVAQAALTDVPEAADALAKLCETYWLPIYSFIRRRVYAGLVNFLIGRSVLPSYDEARAISQSYG